jgi:hypothetical protein
MRVRFPLSAIRKASIEALTAHDFGHFRCGLRSEQIFRGISDAGTA